MLGVLWRRHPVVPVRGNIVSGPPWGEDVLRRQDCSGATGLLRLTSRRQARGPLLSDELLTPEETAALLKVTVRTLRYWREQGTGPQYVRVGRRVRYRRRDLDAWLRQHEGE